MKYKNLFIDLDDTIYDFTESSREVYREVYDLLHYERFFNSFEHYLSLYEPQNILFWTQYGNKEIDKKELNRLRYSYPLQAVGAANPGLAAAFCRHALQRMPYKGKLMPYAKEALDYLKPKYRLFILTNGFRELQERKMQSTGGITLRE